MIGGGGDDRNDKVDGELMARGEFAREVRYWIPADYGPFRPAP